MNLPFDALPVPRLPGFYVTKGGQVFGLRGREVGKNPSKGTNGYRRFAVSCNSARNHQRYEYVHTVVAEVFIGRRPKGKEVDHKNRDRADSRARNLRYVSISTQIQNSLQKRRKKHTHFRGVFLNKLAKRKGQPRPWGACIAVAGRTHSLCLGYFRKPIEAARAYDRAAISEHGPLALTNKRLGFL